MSTPTLDQFLSELSNILQVKDAPKLKDYLVIEPEFPPIYNVIVNELRQINTLGSNALDTLERKCEKLLPEDGGDKGGTWTAFNSFLAQYFVFIRDVDTSKLVETHEGLKNVLKYAIPRPTCMQTSTHDLTTALAFSPSQTLRWELHFSSQRYTIHAFFPASASVLRRTLRSSLPFLQPRITPSFLRILEQP